MNREIRFRAWFYDGRDLSTGEMIDLQTVFSEDLVGVDDYSIKPHDECTILMQYTGLKDKNGVEIYEGDVYRYGRFALNDIDKFGDTPYANLPEGTMEDDITTEHARFGVKFEPELLLLLQRQIESNPDVDGVEVIGNIYENPELMEGE